MKPPKILDNKKNRVVDELKAELRKGTKLSIIYAYFTIYAYAELTMNEFPPIGDINKIITFMVLK